jgi:hypothetical protein
MSDKKPDPSKDASKTKPEQTDLDRRPETDGKKDISKVVREVDGGEG